MAKLILKLGDEVIREFLLGRGALTIGRKDDNDIQIESKEVSGLHAKLFNYGGNFFIQDMESLNGTFVNNKRIVKHHLSKGDIINIGQYTLVFRYDPDKEEADQENKQKPEGQVISPPEEPESEQGASEIQDFIKEVNNSNISGGFIVLSSSKKQSVYPIKKKVTTIGVGKDVDVKLKSGLYDTLFVSKAVAIINKKARGYLITPSSVKTVKINGYFLEEPYLLQDGDIVEFNGTSLQFYLTEN